MIDYCPSVRLFPRRKQVNAVEYIDASLPAMIPSCGQSPMIHDM